MRAENSNIQAAPGSIWIDSGRLTRMMTDVRAMRPHDLISVVVSENLAASTDGTVKNSRASNANSPISGLIGTLTCRQRLAKSDQSNFLSWTQCTRNQCDEFQPEYDFWRTSYRGSSERNARDRSRAAGGVQSADTDDRLHGLVRPEDISQQNQVLSTAISSLELEVRGKGIINDYTHRQNVIVRLLQKVLIF